MYSGGTEYGFTSSAARWIWTETSGGSIDRTIYCRKTLTPTMEAQGHSLMVVVVPETKFDYVYTYVYWRLYIFSWSSAIIILCLHVRATLHAVHLCKYCTQVEYYNFVL